MIKAVIFDMYETLITHYNCPLYFGTQMAADAGISEEKFLKTWRLSDEERTTGKVTFEEIIEKILKENDCFSEKKMNEMVKKRIRCKEECFAHLHPEIIPMLESLKGKGMLIGLISNCFSEEAAVIKESVLYPYFDGVCLSYEEGVQKPDPVIFERCMRKLGVKADECLYVGDGGSNELETAASIGMKAVQAVWYYQEGIDHPLKRKMDFEQVERPMDILDYVDKPE